MFKQKAKLLEIGMNKMRFFLYISFKTCQGEKLLSRVYFYLVQRKKRKCQISNF